MSTWSRIAQASGGAFTEDDLERAAVRLATYQVIYAGDHGARHAYDLITMNLPAYQAVFAPFGRTVIHRASAGYVVVLSKHRVSPRMPLVQTRLAIVLRRLFNDKMERADTINGEIVCETLELQHAWTEYLKLEWKFRVGDLEDALTALKRYGIVLFRREDDGGGNMRIVIRSAIEDVIGEQVLHQLAQYGTEGIETEDEDETA